MTRRHVGDVLATAPGVVIVVGRDGAPRIVHTKAGGARAVR